MHIVYIQKPNTVQSEKQFWKRRTLLNGGATVARHDLICDTCSLIIRDIVINGNKIGKGGKVKQKCPDCGNRTFHTYWGSGEAPVGSVTPVTNEEKYDKSKTIGEFWERTGVNPQSKEYHKASKRRIESMRQKAMAKKLRAKKKKGPKN